MKHVKKILPTTFIFFLVLPLMELPALDLGGTYFLGNLDFSNKRTSDQSSFDGLSFPMGFSLFAKENLSESVGLDISLFWEDRILRNHVSAIFSYQEAFFTLMGGPFFGYLNSGSTLIKPGVFTGLRLDWPGILYVSLSAGSSFGGALITDGDYTQAMSKVSLGFYIFNAIASVRVENQQFTIKASASEHIIDSLTIYAFDTDISQENIPFRILLRFAYHHMVKSFLQSTGTEVNHVLNSLVVGTDMEIDFNPTFTLLAGLESSVYTFGHGYLTGISNPGPGGLLFHARIGFTLHL